MGPHADILGILALTLIGAKLIGEIGQRFGLPTSVGMIMVGLVIGPTAIGVVGDAEEIEVFATVGVVLLMFLAGLETDLDMMRRVSGPAFAVAVGGVALPFLGGLGIGYAFGLQTHETLFIGALMTATSVSISAQTLREMGRLQSLEGTTILAAAVIDDILGIVVLAFVFSMTGEGDPSIAIGKMLVFLPVAFGLGWLFSAPVARRVEDHLSEEAQLTIGLGVALAFAWAAERLGGIAGVTGAYMAGLSIARTNLVHKVSHGLIWVGNSFFVPLFFIGIGLQANFSSIVDAPLLVASLTVVAMVSKVAGCYVGARICRFRHAPAVTVGIGMMSRGEVALVIAAAGLNAGVVESSIFSATIVMALATTLVTPVLLKIFGGETEMEDEADMESLEAYLETATR